MRMLMRLVRENKSRLRCNIDAILEMKFVRYSPIRLLFKSYGHTITMGVATMSRLLKIIGLFCERAL